MADTRDIVRLREMADAARKAVRFAEGRTRADLDSDELLSLALVRLLEIVGEAARGVSEALRHRQPTVPWSQITGTRDRLIHGYFNVDLDIVWAIIQKDLPSLIADLNRIISAESKRS